MAKTRQDKIDNLNERIAQLENQRKEEHRKQKAEERKIRDRRLYKRAGLLESLLPETIPLTDEQFNTFLHRTVANSFGRDKLTQIIAEGNSNPPANAPTVQAETKATAKPNTAGQPQANNTANAPKSAETQKPTNASNSVTNQQSQKPNTPTANPTNPQPTARSGGVAPSLAKGKGALMYHNKLWYVRSAEGLPCRWHGWGKDRPIRSKP